MGPATDKYQIPQLGISTRPDLSTLNTTLPHKLIKDKLLIVLKESSEEKALCTLHVTTEVQFSLQNSLNNITHAHVKMYVKR